MPIIQSLSTSMLKEQKKVDDNQLALLADKIVEDIVLKETALISAVDRNEADFNLLVSTIRKRIVKYANNEDHEQILKYTLDKIYHYDIVQDYVQDEDISDIDFTRFDYGTYKKNGVKRELPVKFKNEQVFRNFCNLVILRNGGILDENDSHWRIADKEYRLRVNVSIPPRNRTGSAMIIRKHRKNPYKIEDLFRLGMLSKEEAAKLKKMINTDTNFLICGKGASGKTTLLRALLMELDPLKSVLIAEKDTELYLNDYKNFIIQKIKKKEEGGREVTLKDLIQDGLTMSLDGYCVGEIIGEEAWDFINAGFTDHRIFGTLHATSPKESITRLMTMMNITASGLSEQTVKSIIGKTLDVIIYLKDFKLDKMIEVKGYDPGSNKMILA